MQAAAAAGHTGSFGASSDWLLALIAQISGETPPGVGDELRLTEDLLLDSLGRIQLAAAIEQRLAIVTEEGALDRAVTLGELRAIVEGHASEQVDSPSPGNQMRNLGPTADSVPAVQAEAARRGAYIYPEWPWTRVAQWVRVAFIEAVERPLVWLLAAPRVVASTAAAETGAEPLLIIANHVTSYDMPIIQYALTGVLRRRMAVAMSGEMLEAYRHFRNPKRTANREGFYLPGRLYYWLITALFNAFPLPRLRDFQPAFTHAGKAMDHGYNVLVFPEGTRSASGELARFRPGIGLLTKQCGAAVRPVALTGLGELKTAGRGWFRSGQLAVRVGEPIRFTSAVSEAEITAQLHAAVERLLAEE
jgi:long-chain acyl-CoA synthetase